MKERQIYKTTDYDPDEFALLLALISADNYENILKSLRPLLFRVCCCGFNQRWNGQSDLKYLRKVYNASQLKEITGGHGKSLFDINQEQKGGYSLFGNRKMPSMFGGKGYECSEGHTLISMKTWRT